MCRNLRFRMCQKTSFFECVAFGDYSNDGRNAAGVASVRRRGRHTAHERMDGMTVGLLYRGVIRACAHCARRWCCWWRRSC